jgi:hypothetical protein
MGMTHSTSGKRGFDLYKNSTSCIIDRETLIKILKREDILRFSDEVQQQYTMAGENLKQIESVTADLQKKALAEFGFTDPEALIALHNVRFYYQNDPEINQLTVYMRKDRCIAGKLYNGCNAPNTTLFSLNGKKTTLFDYKNSIDPLSERSLVICAGSIS